MNKKLIPTTIAAMGSSSLGIIAGTCIGGTIYQDIDKYNSLFVSKFKNTWSFTASNGEKFGPYTYVY